MTLLYTDPRYLHHETGLHPERAERIRALPGRLEEKGLAGRCTRPAIDRASRERIGRVHGSTYIHEVWATAKSGGGELDADTVVGPGSFDVARLAAGALCDATERVLRGQDHQAFCLVRPPGHHAMAGHGMGFCLFNNIAVAAKVATEEFNLDRVLIVDWDVHHGNGTQATFWEDPRVGFLSMHRWPFYPGTGRADETGGGDGLGTIVNLPVSFGTPREEQLALFRDALGKLADKIRPEIVFVSAGFDNHRLDPLGGLGLETEDFGELTDMVLDVADAHAEGRVVSTLEGGYDPNLLADCVELHLGEMLGRNAEGAPS